MPEYGLQQLAKLLKLETVADGDVRIRGVATLEEAGPGRMAYAESVSLLPQVKATQAAVVLVRLPEMLKQFKVMQQELKILRERVGGWRGTMPLGVALRSHPRITPRSCLPCRPSSALRLRLHRPGYAPFAAP